MVKSNQFNIIFTVSEKVEGNNYIKVLKLLGCGLKSPEE